MSRRPLDATEVARRALERAGVSADKLAAPAAAMPLSADPTLLARALANLIDNARKHGGGVDRLSVTARGDRVTFEVADRGPGFAAGEETRVFASFYRGHHADAGERGRREAMATPPRAPTRSASGWRWSSASPKLTVATCGPPTVPEGAR